MSDVEKALGRLVASLPGGGETRDGQAQMAKAVESAIATGRHLVVRAGTGTGKSFAYLVPSLLSGNRVVVATATKALQDQLAEKDLPALEGHLGRSFDAAVLKGRSNYLCRQRLVEGAETGEQGRLGEEPHRAASGERQRQAKAILEWAQVTTQGDRAELSFEVDERVWSAFSVASEECPGAFRCPSGQSCFAEAARQAAAAADMVVVNLHLLGAHLAAGDTVLPEFDVLVVDEAHELDEVLTRSLGLSVSPGRLRALASLARSSAAPPSTALQQACDSLLEVASRLEDVLRARLGQRVLNGEDEGLASQLQLCAAALQRVERALGVGQDEQSAKAARAVLTIGRLREQLDRLGSLDERSVAWVEDQARPTLQIAPIDVSELLSERVFGRSTVVLTSATVPPDLALRLGADPASTDELDVGSPFEFEQNAMLYCAAHLPDPRRPDAEQAIHDELAALIDAAGGRTLALFTSRRAMESAANALRARISYPVLCQGDASKSQLVETFRADEESCLFATMGFWQGIDVPGQSLSLVTIDRLPFGRPDDPLLSARRTHAGPDAFRMVDLPRTASLLAQGAGRLIRTASDRGVVAVLDPRLATASYRWALVRSLPPMRRTKSRVEVEAFLRDLRGAGHLTT